jgi:hypothetical protein
MVAENIAVKHCSVGICLGYQSDHHKVKLVCGTLCNASYDMLQQAVIE